MRRSFVNPTQERQVDRTRCPHGYYLHARELGTPRCEMCHRDSFPLDARRTRDALALIAIKHGLERRRTDEGRFPPEASVAPGVYRCWCCRRVLPLDEKHFRRAASKATGYQTRCKQCDNAQRFRRRQGLEGAGVRALQEAGR